LAVVTTSSPPAASAHRYGIAYARRTMFRTALTVILLVGILGSTTALAQTASDDTPASTPDASLTSISDASLTDEQGAELLKRIDDAPVPTYVPNTDPFLTDVH
jgi:hypothetical protein